MVSTRTELLVFAVIGGAVLLYVWKRGGLAGAAAGAGAAVVEAAGAAANAAASTAVGAIGSTVGLPTPAQTTTDPAVARWLLDNVGWGAASAWSSAGAFFTAMGRPQGSGTPPAEGTELARLYPWASYDETERLLRRYPAPAPEPEPYYSDPMTGYTWGAMP